MKKRQILMATLVVALFSTTQATALPRNNAAEATESITADSAKVIDIEELVVIATPKENNKLRQQPVSSTSFSQNDMRNNAIHSVKSLTGLVPNLFIPDYGSKLTTSVYVRGIGSRINTPAVGLYVDNIPFIDKSAFDFNYSDVERIDILRGPQGTLYGRNTMGGLIRIFTKSPFTYQGTDVNISAATYNSYKASVTHYHRISSQFAFSVGAFYEHDGGFFKNTARSDEKVDKGDETGGRIRAIYKPSDNLKFDLTLNYEYMKQGGYPYTYTGIVEGEEDRGEYIGKIAYNHRSGYKRHLLNSGLNIEHQSEHFILNSVTGFQYLKDRMDLDQDFTEQDIYTMLQKQNSKTLSQELVFKSKPGRRWEWTSGISGFYQWLNTEAPVTFRADGLDWLNGLINNNANKYLPQIQQGPMSMSFIFSDVINGNTLPIEGSFKTPQWNGAIFHQSTFNDLFGAKGLSVTVGLRMDYETMWLDYNTGCNYTHTYSLKGNLATPGGEMVIPMIGEQTFTQSPNYNGHLKHDYFQLLPKVALKYDFNERNNLYATVSKGYRSGGFNIQMFSDILQNDMQSGNMKDVAEVTVPVIENQPMIGEDIKSNIIGILNGMSQGTKTDVKNATLYKPEYSWNYEIGAHLNFWNNRLKTDVAVFYMDTHDQQISRFAANGLGRITVNAGKSRSVGTEAALQAQLTDELSLNGSYGFTHATFTDYAVSDEVNYNGNFVPFVPMHTFNAGMRYVITLAHCTWLEYITVNANYRGAGKIYWTEANNACQSLYGTLNGRISFDKGRGQIGLWINNALNTKYQTIYFETMSRGFAQTGKPMQLGIDFHCRF